MRPLRHGLALALPFAVALLLPLAVRASSPLARGDGDFWLGMTRAEVDSAVAARGDSVITDDTAFLVCSGAERNIEYVQYSFWRAPHDLDLLWRVTIGYRLGATTRDFADARDRLVRVLGEPQREAAADPGATNQARAGMQLVSWDDPFISVSLGARWTDHPDPGADRMLVTWTDRRMQKLMQARGKKEPKK